jgi:hypothetical protein
MTDVDTGTRAFPTVAQQANFATRRSENASGDRTWALVADDKFFYLFARSHSTTERYAPIYFGDISSFDPADSNACVIGATNVATPVINNFANLISTSSNESADRYISSANGEYANGAKPVGVYGSPLGVSAIYVALNPASYPASTNLNGGLVLVRAGIVCEKTSAANAVRGMMPGYHVALVKPDSFISSGSHAIALVDGNPFILVNASAYTYGNLIGIDLGDWR